MDKGMEETEVKTGRVESHGNHGNTDTLYLLGANRWCRVPRLLRHLLIAIGEQPHVIMEELDSLVLGSPDLALGLRRRCGWEGGGEGEDNVGGRFACV